MDAGPQLRQRLDFSSWVYVVMQGHGLTEPGWTLYAGATSLPVNLLFK